MHWRYLCQNCLWAVRNTYLAMKKETRLSWTTICQNSFWSRWHASAWMWQQLLNWVFACQKVIVSLQGFVTFKLRQTPKIDSFHCKDQQGKKKKKKKIGRGLNASVDFSWEYEISFNCFRQVEFSDLWITNRNSCQKQFTFMCSQQLYSCKCHKNKIKLSLKVPRNFPASLQPQQCRHILYYEQISDYGDTDIHTALIFRTLTDMPADSGDVLCVPV